MRPPAFRIPRRRALPALASLVIALVVAACGRESGVFEPLALDPASGAVVAGTVRAEGGAALARAVVTLEASTGGIPASVRRRIEQARAGRTAGRPLRLAGDVLLSTVTDAEGRFRFEGVAPGEYLVSARTSDHLAGGRRVQVPSAAEAVTVEIFLTPTGSFHGQVTLENAATHPSTVVFVEGTSYVAVTDPAGQYVIGGVPLGSWTVRATHGGYLDRTTTGAIAAAGDSVPLPALELPLDSNIPPVAWAAAPAGPVIEGVPASFSGSGTDDDGVIVLYEWDFENDGTFDYASPTTAATDHTYPTAGTYTAKLRVTDDQGAIGLDAVSVEVASAPTNAIYVSATTGVSGNPGTPTLPLPTIAEGIAAAVSGGQIYVRVAGGVYTESPVFVAGKHVEGGYDAGTWTQVGALTQVNVGVNPASASGIAGPTATQVSRLTITASNSPTGNSIALYSASSSPALQFFECTFVAGNGAAGSAGANAGGNGVAGSNGTPGQSGTCDAAAGAGGTGGASAAGCPGGAGGAGGPEGANNGFPGNAGSCSGGAGGAPGAGGELGGTGGPGTPGASGINGPSGAGGSGVGSVIAGQWVPSSGGVGVAGTAGRGGGGGGGGGGQGGTLVNNGGGNGGGGGGGGGEGGGGGSGGSGGYGSFAVFLFNSSTSFTNCTFDAGNGGTGGIGRAGGSGGAGGGGGVGASHCTSEIGRGGNGGAGGTGGAGGHGGGGGGGVSWCVYRAGTSAPGIIGATYITGSGGAGGTSPGNAGSTGVSGTIF